MNKEVEKILNELNFKEGQNSSYYVTELKKRGIVIKEDSPEKIAARYHLAKYGKIDPPTLVKLVKKYKLESKKLIAEVQKDMEKIYYNELIEILNK